MLKNNLTKYNVTVKHHLLDFILDSFKLDID